MKEHETLVSEKHDAIRNLKEENKKLISELEEATEHSNLLEIEVFGNHTLFKLHFRPLPFLANLAICGKSEDNFCVMTSTGWPEKHCKT
jgi:hypothetical protein